MKKKSNAGRPHGTKKRDSRTRRVYVRVHPDEEAELKRRAARRGMSVSEYLLISSLGGKDEDAN